MTRVRASQAQIQLDRETSRRKASREPGICPNWQWPWQIARCAVPGGKNPVAWFIVWCPTPMPVPLASGLITTCFVATRTGKISSFERKPIGTNSFFVNHQDLGRRLWPGLEARVPPQSDQAHLTKLLKVVFALQNLQADGNHEQRRRPAKVGFRNRFQRARHLIGATGPGAE